jgi:hypothetical protein
MQETTAGLKIFTQKTFRYHCLFAMGTAGQYESFGRRAQRGRWVQLALGAAAAPRRLRGARRGKGICTFVRASKRAGRREASSEFTWTPWRPWRRLKKRENKEHAHGRGAGDERASADRANVPNAPSAAGSRAGVQQQHPIATGARGEMAMCPPIGPRASRSCISPSASERCAERRSAPEATRPRRHAMHCANGMLRLRVVVAMCE